MSRFGRGQIIPLIGVSGSGKTKILTCLSEQKVSNQQDWRRRLAFVDLQQGRQDFVHRTRGFSPIAVISLSLLWHDLNKIFLPSYVDRESLPGGPKLFNEGDLLSNLPLLVDRLNRAQLGTVLIDNGQLLDSPALDWLLYLSRCCTHPFSIVIAIAYRPGTKEVDAIKHLRSAVNYAPQPITLELLSKEELLQGYNGEKPILNQLVLGIKAKFAPELRPRGEHIGQQIWDWTGGNWKAMYHVMGLFDEELGPDSPDPRPITYAVFERVEERLTGLKQVWGELLEPIPSLKKLVPESVP